MHGYHFAKNGRTFKNILIWDAPPSTNSGNFQLSKDSPTQNLSLLVALLGNIPEVEQPPRNRHTTFLIFFNGPAFSVMASHGNWFETACLVCSRLDLAAFFLPSIPFNEEKWTALSCGWNQQKSSKSTISAKFVKIKHITKNFSKHSPTGPRPETAYGSQLRRRFTAAPADHRRRSRPRLRLRLRLRCRLLVQCEKSRMRLRLIYTHTYTWLIFYGTCIGKICSKYTTIYIWMLNVSMVYIYQKNIKQHLPPKPPECRGYRSYIEHLG